MSAPLSQEALNEALITVFSHAGYDETVALPLAEVKTLATALVTLGADINTTGVHASSNTRKTGGMGVGRVDIRNE